MFKKLSLLLLSILLVFSWSIINAYAQTATINASTVQQYIRGFGAANIIGWRDDLNSADRITAFSVTNGLGFSVLRVRVSPDSADWPANQATIDAAKDNGAMVIASAWSAPASMKTNNSTIGGNLSTSAYTAYAAHLKGFCSTLSGIDAISPINEPNITVSYESMEMSAYDVANFVAAQGNNCGAPIFAPEPFNMDQSFINQYLSNSGAKANTAYIAGHIYGVAPSYFNPGKEVWMTEHYVDSGTNGNDWTKSMNVAKELHDCMNAGYSMYVWWYIKRFYGPIEEDGTITKTGYVMAQFARYVRPGFNKISCTANPSSNVYTTAYKNGSDLVIVAVNRNSSSVSQSFSLSGITVSGFNTYTTTSSSNLASGSVTVSGTSFSVSLPGSSIMTLVSGGGTVTPVPTDVPTAGPTPVPGTIAIACGSSSDVGNFLADQYYSGGSTYNNTNTIDVSQIITDPPPAALFNNERYGAMSYTIPGFTSGNSYTVTLYFAETYLTSDGGRVFNVSINGTTVLSNFDIFAAAGGQNKAIAREFTATANSSGQIAIQFTSVTENPKINGISILPGEGPTTAPTVAPTTPPGDCNVSFDPDNLIQGVNSNFQIDIVVDSGNQELAAYGLTVTYNANILSVVDVEEGADGFLAAANTSNPGEIIASGFDASGTGPGSNLQVLIITFNAIAQGTSTLGMIIDQLVDGETNPIGTACGNSGSVEVTDVSRGDTNGDGNIDIVDALLTAQYYVSLDPPNFIPGNADTNCDGNIDIVDALLIAQFYVGLINQFC